MAPPPRPTHHRERSLTKLPSPKLPLRQSLPTPTDSSGNIRNSWPESTNGTEEAPPLPPRGQSKYCDQVVRSSCLLKFYFSS